MDPVVLDCVLKLMSALHSLTCVLVDLHFGFAAAYCHRQVGGACRSKTINVLPEITL